MGEIQEKTRGYWTLFGIQMRKDLIVWGVAGILTYIMYISASVFGEFTYLLIFMLMVGLVVYDTYGINNDYRDENEESCQPIRIRTHVTTVLFLVYVVTLLSLPALLKLGPVSDRELPGFVAQHWVWVGYAIALLICVLIKQGTLSLYNDRLNTRSWQYPRKEVN